ncbi:MAG TPA: DUF4429 domain-containing protein [Clostridia bacterium]|nr:DUF4429 domain-containing protein [Clostridia bacterium]
MSDALMELKGINGQLELYEDKIVMKRKGALSKLTQGFFKGDKSIYLSQISEIQVKPGTWATNGYIQFTLSGGNENTKGIFDATKDENAVIFSKKDNDLVSRIKDKIEELKTSLNKTGTVINSLSPADEIKKYKELLDDGIITEEEFNKKKKDLLGL